MIHEDLKLAIEKQDYETICSFLHSKTFSSDSEFTVQRCCDSFIQGWKECERITQKLRDQNDH